MRFGFSVITVLLSLSLVSPALAGPSWNGVIYDVEASHPIDTPSLHEALSSADAIALGEKHYTPAIQAAQAALIEGVVRRAKREGKFSVGWEFLARTQQVKIQAQFSDFVSGKITAEQFLTSTQGQASAIAYRPILEAVKRLGGELLALNLTREEKKPAVQGGLAAMDPKLVPPQFVLGGTNYLTRFAEAFGQSPHAQSIQNYFVAQCLTDAWMAHTLLTEAKNDFRFLIAGAFHVDYRDGAVQELRTRGHADRTRSVTFVDASDYQASELLPLLKHKAYGSLADYVVFVNEPK